MCGKSPVYGFIRLLILMSVLGSAMSPARAQTSASFLGFDTSTQGTWHGVYGSDGYSIANDSQSLPSYASFSVTNQSNFTWAASTTDVRALQKGSGSGRLASTWFSGSSFNFDVNVTDGNTHQFGLYALDWDSGGRVESIQVADASTLSVLDTRSVSSFTNGTYLFWNIAGHVKIIVTVTAGPNAVISGAFWDSVGTFIPPPTISSVSPSSGVTGTSVTVAGSNFGATQGSSTITFNGVAASATWSASSITTTVPSAASSGPVVVTVAGRASNGVAFSVTPHISGLSPSTGGPNAFVNISGSGFGPTVSSSTVTFNGAGAQPQSWSATSVVVPVPATASSGSVVVTVAGTASNGVSFTYASSGAVAGTITRASDGGPVVGALVQALQSGLQKASSASAADGSYSIGGLAPGVYDVSVTASGLLNSVRASNLVVAASTTTVNVAMGIPTISALSPNDGTTGQPITVTGSFFGSAMGSSSVSFNGVVATPATWADNRITVPVPSGAATGPVVVTVSGISSTGTSFTVGTGSFSGSVTRSSDGSVVSGALVEVLQANIVKASGTSLSDGTYTVSGLAPSTYDLRFSASALGTVLQSNKTATAGGSTTVNAALPGSSAISGTVTKSDGVTAISGATVSALQGGDIVASTISDSSGNYSVSTIAPGSYSVQAAATGYKTQTQTGVTVSAGVGTTQNFSLAGQSVINYSYDAVGRLTGVVDSQGSAAAYSYDAVGNLLDISNNPSTQVSISGFTPISGSAGQSVSVHGTAFSTNPSLDTVTFNGSSATVVSATATELTVTVPTGATTGTISVTAPAGTATSASPFTIASSLGWPTISSFSPSLAAVATAITITGSNFDIPGNDRTKVNVSMATVSSATSTSIATTVPKVATTGHISVSTPAGKAISTGYLFVPPSSYTVANVGFTGSVSIGGSATTVSISTAHQVGLVAFDGSKAQQVFVNMTSSTFGIGGVNVSLLRPDGTTQATICCGASSFDIDTQTLGVTGTYTLVIVPQGTSVGGVAVQVLSSPVLQGTITENGPPVNVTTTAGQNESLTFFGSAGQDVSINLTGSTYPFGNLNLTLFRPDGTTQGSICCGNSFMDAQTLPTSGTYTILVDPQGASTGSVAVQLFAFNMLTGTITPNGGAVPVTTTSPGQNEALTFSGTAGQSVSVNLTSSTYAFGTLNVSLVRPDGSTQTTLCCGNTFLDAQTLATTGTYTVLIDPQGAATGSVSVTLYQFNMLSGSITPNGSAVPVTTTSPGQNEALTFSGTAGQSVSVNLTSSTYAFGTLNVSLVRPDGSTQTTLCCGNTFLDAQTLATTGTYTVLIDPQGAATGSVSVTLYQFSMLSGSITPNGSAVPVSTSVPGQNETLTFSGTAGQIVSIALASSTYPSGLNFYLIRPDGSTQATGCCGGLSIGSQTLATTGTYSILIDPQGAGTGGVTVTLTSP